MATNRKHAHEELQATVAQQSAELTKQIRESAATLNKHVEVVNKKAERNAEDIADLSGKHDHLETVSSCSSLVFVHFPFHVLIFRVSRGESGACFSHFDCACLLD